MKLKNIDQEEEEMLWKAGFDDTAYQAKKPAYISNYGDRIDNLLDSLGNRTDFSYDAESDPAYRQYRDQYRREGQRATEDTLAAAASHAGGMNSYAVTAARQAGDLYNAKLMDALPELAQLAYERYRTDYEDDLAELDALRRQESEAYGHYQDALADWYTELENAYQQYRDSVKDSQWQQEQEYEAQRDAEADRQWQESFDYEKEQDALAYEKWLQQQAYAKEQDALDYEKWQQEQAYKQQQADREYEQWLRELALKLQGSRPEQEVPPAEMTPPAVTAPPVEKDEPDDSAPAAPYTGTDYYQDAINAAVRGDRATAEAALKKREAKIADPAYGGNGGGTSMNAARQYIESLLASSEDADISERDASGMLNKSEWKEKRASGSGVEASYATYEDYVSDYLRYLTREGA